MKCPICCSALVRENELYGDRVDRCVLCARRFPVPEERPAEEVFGKQNRKRNEPVAKGKKRCRKCEKVKPRTAFYAHPTHADGRFGTCKECIKKRQREEFASRKQTNKGEAA